MPSSAFSISLGFTACEPPRSISDTLLASISLRLSLVPGSAKPNQSGAQYLRGLLALFLCDALLSVAAFRFDAQAFEH